MAKLIYFFVVGSFASLSTVLLAAEAEAGTFSSMAERWGLWAALTLVLIGAMMWALQDRQLRAHHAGPADRESRADPGAGLGRDTRRTVRRRLARVGGTGSRQIQPA